MRFIGSFLLALTAAIIVVGFSISNFSDTETSNTNTTTAGTLNLNLLAGGITVSDPLTANNLSPGVGSSKLVSMQNSGSVPISEILLSASNVSGSVYLYDKLGVRIYDGAILLLTDSLKNLSDYSFYTNLAAGATGTRTIEVFLPGDSDGTYQGLTTSWQFSFLAKQ